METARKEAKKDKNSNLTLYNHFFMHALDEKQGLVFLKEVTDVTKTGDMFYMEFRCSLDDALDKEYGKGHYHRNTETDNFLSLLKSLGFKINYHITGQSMAKYKAEDPFVSHIICERV